MWQALYTNYHINRWFGGRHRKPERAEKERAKELFRTAHKREINAHQAIDTDKGSSLEKVDLCHWILLLQLARGQRSHADRVEQAGLEGHGLVLRNRE